MQKSHNHLLKLLKLVLMLVILLNSVIAKIRKILLIKFFSKFLIYCYF